MASEAPYPGLTEKWRDTPSWTADDPAQLIPAHHDEAIDVFYTSDTLLGSPSGNYLDSDGVNHAPVPGQGHHDALAEDLSELQAVLQQMTHRAERAESQQAALEEALAEARAVLGDLQRQNADLVARLTDTQRQAEERDGQMLDLRRLAEQWHAAAQSHQSSNQLVTSKLQASQQRVQVMELTITALKQELAAFKHSAARPSPLRSSLPQISSPSSLEPVLRSPGVASVVEHPTQGTSVAPPISPATSRIPMVPQSGSKTRLAASITRPSLDMAPIGSPSSPAPSAPYGSDMSLQELLERTAAAEQRLLEAGSEKNMLEAELARLPITSAGRTIKERKRKEEIESRLDELSSKMSYLRLELKRVGGR